MEDVSISAIIHQDRTTVDATQDIDWMKMEDTAMVMSMSIQFTNAFMNN